jgi:mRNA interferase RelE/StbE
LHRIELTRAAVRQLRNLDSDVRRRIETAIESLADTPRPDGCRKLTGLDKTWRIRVGGYRVIYEVHDDRLVVIVVRVAHRRDVYR